MNPSVFLFDHEEARQTGELRLKYALPYDDLSQLPAAQLQRKLEAQEPLQFSHSLEAQIGGQLAAGFVITGFYEDRWFDDGWPFARHSPVSFATRALRPAA